FLLLCYPDSRHLHSFPTRRSSDLGTLAWTGGEAEDTRNVGAQGRERANAAVHSEPRTDRFSGRHIWRRQTGFAGVPCGRSRFFGDRKSTRLNSSHVAISYAVFCLK